LITNGSCVRKERLGMVLLESSWWQLVIRYLCYTFTSDYALACFTFDTKGGKGLIDHVLIFPHFFLCSSSFALSYILKLKAISQIIEAIV
jgi:hypothetical protein